MLARGKVAGRLVITLGAKIARSVHHQPRIRGHLTHHCLVERVGVSSFALHRDPCGEGCPPRNPGQRIKARGGVGILGEQQGIDPAIMVRRGEAATIAAPNRLLVRRADVRRGPGLSRSGQGIVHPPTGRVGVGQPGPTIAGGGLGIGVESKDGAGTFARLHGLFGPAAHLRLLGPARVGVEEAGVIGEPIIAALPKGAPIVDRGGNALRGGGRIARVGRRGLILRRA